MATASTDKPLHDWLRNPNSWISLTAAAISGITFFLVYVDRGEIEVLLPHNIGIGISAEPGNLGILVPATFSNTGAPRSRRHIRHITGFIKSLDNAVPAEGTIEWTYEHRFVGRDEFFKLYPSLKDEGFRDYIVYVGRAIPFSLKGGDSVSKLLELERPIGSSISGPSRMQLDLVLHTESGDFKARSVYNCPKGLLPEGSAVWCHQEVDPN